MPLRMQNQCQYISTIKFIPSSEMLKFLKIGILEQIQHSMCMPIPLNNNKVVVVQLLSCVQLLQPHGLVCQGPLFMGFLRQEYWSGLPSPSPGYLPDPGIEPVSPALQVDSLLLSHQGSPQGAGSLTLIIYQLWGGGIPIATQVLAQSCFKCMKTVDTNYQFKNHSINNCCRLQVQVVTK